MAQQVGDPLAVLDVRLMPRNRLHVLGVDQNDLEAAFQDVQDGSPINARTFHGHMRHALAPQPVGQRQQSSGGGSEGAYLATHPATRRGEQQAGHHRFLVDIQSSAASIQDCQTHCRTPFRSAILAEEQKWSTARGAKGTTSFLLVLTGNPVVTLSSAGRARISLKHGLGVPNPDDLVSLSPGLFYPIFMLLSEAEHHGA